MTFYHEKDLERLKSALAMKELINNYKPDDAQLLHVQYYNPEWGQTSWKGGIIGSHGIFFIIYKEIKGVKNVVCLFSLKGNMKPRLKNLNQIIENSDSNLFSTKCFWF